jgi:hypothetical protein
MAPTTPTTSDPNVPARPWSAVFPPEEKFWQRYSRNHEFSLSTFLAAALYVLAAFLIFFGGYALYKWSKRADVPLSVEAIQVQGDPRRGDPNDRGAGPADRAPDPGPEAAVKAATGPPQAAVKNVPVQTVEPKPVNLPPVPDGRPLATTGTNFNVLTQMSKDARDKLLKDLKQPGPDKGKPGTPDGVGDSPPGASIRIERMKRWQLYFRVVNVRDHIRQFAALGAILAASEGDDQYRVYRDLNQAWPLRGKIEDVGKLNRIPFVDTYSEHPDSVAEISRALGLAKPAARIIALFPQTLEEEMRQLEEKFRRKKEEDIHETIRFDVVPRGEGYGVIVSPNQPR